MDKLSEILHLFIEKHLMPTIIAILGTALIRVFIDENSPVFLKLGDFFLPAAFALSFLVVKILQALIQGAKRFLGRIMQNAEDSDHRITNIKRNLEEMWSFVDAQSPADREILLDFVRNGNRPYRSAGHFPYNSLFLTPTVVCRTVTRTDIDCQKVMLPNSDGTFKEHTFIPTEEIKEYKLKEDIYSLLKYSYEEYGKISHFE